MQHTNRFLEEELKLAAKPQVYLICDLAHSQLLIKARGLELHRFPLATWNLSGTVTKAGPYRVKSRPQIDRPRLQPGEEAGSKPIDLTTMPSLYTLHLEPSGTLIVTSAPRDQPWLWAKFRLREWWIEAKEWVVGLTGSDTTSTPPRLWLTLTAEHAQSLAWTITDGMALLILAQDLALQP
mgnify:CR=1 FL=1|jgi:hypothetical protein